MYFKSQASIQNAYIFELIILAVSPKIFLVRRTICIVSIISRIPILQNQKKKMWSNSLYFTGKLKQEIWYFSTKRIMKLVAWKPVKLIAKWIFKSPSDLMGSSISFILYKGKESSVNIVLRIIRLHFSNLSKGHNLNHNIGFTNVNSDWTSFLWLIGMPMKLESIK